MIKRIKGLKKDEGGQILILTITILLVLILFMLTVPNVGRIVTAKIRTQTAADAGAYSAAVWMARGMNLITYLNIGIKDTYLWIVGISAVFLIGSTMVGIGYALLCTPFTLEVGKVILTVAANLLAAFFGGGEGGGPLPPIDPIRAVAMSGIFLPQWKKGYIEDVKNLYRLAKKLRKIQDNVAKMVPKIAFIEGSYTAFDNLKGIPSWKIGLVLKPFPLEQIKLESTKDKFLRWVENYSGKLSGERIGGREAEGEIRFTRDGKIQGNFTQRYREARKVSLVYTYHFCRRVCVEWDAQGNCIRQEWRHHTRSETTPPKIYKEDDLGRQYKRMVSNDELTEIAKKDIESEFPKFSDNDWDATCSNPHNTGYEFRRAIIEDIWRDTTTEIPAEARPEPGEEIPLPHAISKDYKPYTLCITAHTPIGVWIGRNLFGNVNTIPGVAIAQAGFYSPSYDPENDKIYTPDWDARLEKLSAVDDFLQDFSNNISRAIGNLTGTHGQNISESNRTIIYEWIKAVKDYLLIH